MTGHSKELTRCPRMAARARPRSGVAVRALGDPTVATPLPIPSKNSCCFWRAARPDVRAPRPGLIVREGRAHRGEFDDIVLLRHDGVNRNAEVTRFCLNLRPILVSMASVRAPSTA